MAKDINSNSTALSLLALAVLTIAACTSGSAIVTGNTRPPIPPKQVTIYLDLPAEFETIGLVTAPSEVWWSLVIQVDYALGELKRQAAKLGANGVLLLACGETTAADTNAQDPVDDCARPARAMTAQGKAIFVKKQ